MTNVESLKFMNRTPRKVSKYARVWEAMNQLRLGGDAAVVSIPKGLESRQFQNRLNAAKKVAEAEGELNPPPKGCRYVNRTLEDGRLAIMVVKEL